MSYETTHGHFFADKTKLVHHERKINMLHFDQLWLLGYEDVDMLYRRKRMLEPLDIVPRKELDGYFLIDLVHQKYQHIAEIFNCLDLILKWDLIEKNLLDYLLRLSINRVFSMALKKWPIAFIPPPVSNVKQLFF